MNNKFDMKTAVALSLAYFESRLSMILKFKFLSVLTTFRGYKTCNYNVN